MTTIFMGNEGAGRGLRFQYKELVVAEINATSSKATAHQLIKLTKACKVMLFLNGLDVDVSVAFTHPERDPNVNDDRLFAFEVPALTPLNFDISGSLGLAFDPGMWIHVWAVGTANTGKLRLFAWG